jgi:hypothetical protein
VVHHAVGDMDHPPIFSSDHGLDNHVAPEQVSLYSVSFFFRKGIAIQELARIGDFVLDPGFRQLNTVRERLNGRLG